MKNKKIKLVLLAMVIALNLGYITNSIYYGNYATTSSVSGPGNPPDIP